MWLLQRFKTARSLCPSVGECACVPPACAHRAPGILFETCFLILCLLIMKVIKTRHAPSGSSVRFRRCDVETQRDMIVA